MLSTRWLVLLNVCAISYGATATPTPADQALAQYFREETARVQAQSSLSKLTSLKEWTDHRDAYREELFEMLGLSPRPEKGDLHATTTGRVEHDEFFVEKLEYQSLPGLYVTGNLYVPKTRQGKMPAILYVCGHANNKEGGVSYGAKTFYQHHGEWLARNGYVCLIIDSLENGELEGHHHGTYREGKWWWNSRGYTPAGVEAWNAIRGLDYLQSRPEVDGERLGVTGRSGGGAYTWYTAALDERVKVAVPVAGITDLQNHVIDGVVSGHCDCMFVVNTYRWDYAKVAALIAPRPLLFSNSDKDQIFPLDGVLRVHHDLAALYKLYKASDKLGLLITEGPHKDTQDLQVPALRWFDRFLKKEDRLVQNAAEKVFKPQQLEVFRPGGLPTDERTTKIHDSFVRMAEPAVPASTETWRAEREGWMRALREKCFAGWPAGDAPLGLSKILEAKHGSLVVENWEFTSQSAVRLPLVAITAGRTNQIKRVYLRVADAKGWPAQAMAADQRAAVERGEAAVVFLAPRGIGPTAPSGDEKQQIQIRRRYMLLGQTLDGMRVWDITRAIAALRSSEMFGDKAISLSADGDEAVNALYASLFVEGLASVELTRLPASHMAGTDYLNVLRFLDVPQAAAMAAERQPVRVAQCNPDEWNWTTQTARRLGWAAERLEFFAGAKN